MKKRIRLYAVLGIILFFAPGYSQAGHLKTGDQEELALILEKCAEYCERLDNISLYFVCDEKITEVINNQGLVRSGLSRPGMARLRLDDQPFNERNTFIYDYQLRRFGEGIDEQRILLKENNKRTNIKDAQLKTKRFRHKNIVFGPIGLLCGEQQEKYNYTKLKDVTFKGNNAVIVEATPKIPEAMDALYGKIWIAKESFSILKIEWNPESMKNYQGIEETARELKAKPKITFVSEYDFEKNNIRFPSKYFVDEIYILANGHRLRRSKITVVYDNYKFFTVDTKVIY